MSPKIFRKFEAPFRGGCKSTDWTGLFDVGDEQIGPAESAMGEMQQMFLLSRVGDDGADFSQRFFADRAMDADDVFRHISILIVAVGLGLATSG